MQSSESKAWLPRSVANHLAQGTVNHYNQVSRKMHPRANKETGLIDDKTGTFAREVKKNRLVKLPA